MADEEDSSTSSAVDDRAFHKNVTKRLDAMTDRQDSIQALSMWIIHHKAQCQTICECWLTALRRSKMPRRLHLFYLANDVVQNCKKKNAKIFLLAFKNVLKDAIVLVRDDTIHEKIERILCIWEERNTYFTDFVNELRQLLNDRESVSALVSSTNYKPDEVIETISRVKMLESNVSVKYKKVLNLKLDASKVEAVKQLKDRSNSSEFAKQFDDSYNKMQTYVKVLENEIEQRGRLIDLLEKGQTYYEVQCDDALVVANAYRNFGLRINNLKKRLDTLKTTLADAEEPLPSPSAEAPSPENSPEQNDQGEDMEMSDNEEGGSSIIVSVDPVTPQTTNSSESVNSSQTASSSQTANSSQGVNSSPGVNSSQSNMSLSDRLAELGGQIPGTASNDPRSQSIQSYNPSEHRRTASPALNQSTATTAKPLDYLSTLITKTNQSTQIKPGGSILKNLTEFAEKVKNPPPQSWQDYKRKQEEKIKLELEKSQAEQAALKATQVVEPQPDAESELQVTPISQSEQLTPVDEARESPAGEISMSYPPEEPVDTRTTNQQASPVEPANHTITPAELTNETVPSYEPVSHTGVTSYEPVSQPVDKDSANFDSTNQQPVPAEPTNHAPLTSQISLEDAPVKELPPGVKPPGPPPGPPPSTTTNVGGPMVSAPQSVATPQTVSPASVPQSRPLRPSVAVQPRSTPPIQQPANTAVRIIRPLTSNHMSYSSNSVMNTNHSPVRGNVTVNPRLASPPRPPAIQRPAVQHISSIGPAGPHAGVPPVAVQAAGYKRPANHMSVQEQQDALNLLDNMHATQRIQPIGQPMGQQLGSRIGQPMGQQIGQQIGQPMGQPRYQQQIGNTQQMYHNMQQPVNKQPYRGYQQYGGNQYY